MTEVLKNDTRAEDFKAFIHEEGRAAASGKDALPNVAIAFVRAIADEVIPVAPDAQGNDAAARVFGWYSTSEGKKAIHDRTDGSVKAQVSKLRALQKFAASPKWDAVDVLNRGIVIRRDLRDNDNEVQPAYAAFVSVAREQLKQDSELTDEQLDAAVRKGTVTREVTVESELKRAAKILEDLITGEGKHGLKDSAPETHQASEAIAARLTQLVTRRTMEDGLNKALETGVISQAEFDAKIEALCFGS